MADLYSKKVMDHFEHPHNMGEVKNADGKGRVGNPVCGDVMQLEIKVSQNEKGEDYIEDIKFKTFGCAAAIATSSMITDLAMGKTLDEAYKIEKSDVAEALDGLPPIKNHCSNLSADALRKAIDDYRSKKS
jgi:nitrogen fixation NifU-like protein